jgi:hypothetical protein
MSFRRSTARIVGATTVVATFALGLGVESAQAKTPKSYSLATLQAVGARAGYHRLVILFQLTLLTNRAHNLPAVQRDALLQILRRDADGIAKFRTRLANETDPVAARADVVAIHERFVVGQLVSPQVTLTVRASTLSATADRYVMLADAINSVVSAKEDDADTTRAENLLADMQKEIATAKGLLDPLPAQLIALDPSGYPGNRKVLDAARRAEDDAQHRLTQSIRTGTRALAALTS